MVVYILLEDNLSTRDKGPVPQLVPCRDAPLYLFLQTLAPPSTADNESDVVYQDSRVGETDGMGFAIGVVSQAVMLKPVHIFCMGRHF